MTKTTIPGNDHPGVYFPPPILYAVVFLCGIALQRLYPMPTNFFTLGISKILGALFIVLALLLTVNSVRQFIVTKNTLIPIKPAKSLQTTGIYGFTRNPMYVGLLILYTGIAFIVGNWWTFILLPALVLAVHALVIRKEEKYLEREFGTEYTAYKKKVRRWL